MATPHPKGIEVIAVPMPPRRRAATPTPQFLLRNPFRDRVATLVRAVGRASLGASLAVSLAACTQTHQAGDDGAGGSVGSGGTVGSGGSVGSGGAVGAGGDVGSGGGGPPPTQGWPLSCDADGNWRPLTGAVDGAQWDYAGLYNWWGAAAAPDAGLPTISAQLLGEYGRGCLLDDPAQAQRCNDDRRSLPDDLQPSNCDAEVGNGCYGYYITATRGSLVQRYTDAAGFLEFIGGSVDSPQEALLLAFLSGVQPALNEGDACRDDVVRKVEGGYIVTSVDWATCADYVLLNSHLVHVDGTVELVGSIEVPGSGACAGRLTAGVELSADLDRSLPPGAHFAGMAQLEAAAVFAFERMARELSHHGAPAALVEAARRAASEEVEHAELVSRLACRHGGSPTAPDAAALPLRDLLAIAIENATEGCVRETLGAAIGSYQAEHASDPEVAAVMDRVADDECGHAELSWQIADWLDTRLDSEQRAHVRNHRQRAIEHLSAASANLTTHPDTARVAGLPSHEAMQQMITTLKQTLWC